MPTKDCRFKDVHFLAEKLDIPLLLTTRNRVKFDPFRAVPNYIQKKRDFYTQSCYTETPKTTKNKEDFKRLFSKYVAKDESCHQSMGMKTKRQPLNKREGNPPPNVYNTTYERFTNKRGLGGAHWKKLKEEIILDESQLKAKKVAAAAKPKEKWKFYNILNGVDRLLLPRNKYKGIFLSNPRSRRASTRSMVNDPVLIYHDPNEPSPAEYNVKLYSISNNLPPRRYHPKPNPHLFPRGSCVPEYPNKLIPRHLSFQPAVGRYEIRYPKHCPCGRKICIPGLQLLIDREKRNKFRHLPYKKIKKELHCDPDWDHVIGHGHRQIFRVGNSKEYKPRMSELKKGSKSLDLSEHIFHDMKYIKMITMPGRETITTRSSLTTLTTVQPRIRFNCIFKNVGRRGIHVDRKVGFGGGAKRFSDYIPTIFTHEKLQKLITNLPPERKLQNQRVTRMSIKDIKPRLDETPQHMKPVYSPNLRKTFFKFPPLPNAKLLVTKKDLLPELAPNEVYSPPRAFNKPINVHDYIDKIVDKELTIENLEQAMDAGTGYTLSKVD